MKKHWIFFLTTLLLILNCDDSSTKPNDLPTCSIISPNTNSEYTAGETINIAVNAQDEDGDIKEVRIYLDDNYQGKVETPPYNYALTTAGLNEGTYTIKAVAYDDKNDFEEAEIQVFIDEMNADEYDGIDDDMYSFDELYYDDFDSDNGVWQVGAFDGGTGSIENGYYEINNTDTTGYFSWINFSDLNPDGNFEIEASIVTTKNNSGGGLIWGAGLTNQYLESYSFLFWDDGTFLVDNDNLDAYVTWYDWAGTDVINSMGENNKLTIRKFNDQYHFFINEELVGTHDFESLHGDGIGFYVPYETLIRIDDLAVYQIAIIDGTEKATLNKNYRNYQYRDKSRKK